MAWEAPDEDLLLNADILNDTGVSTDFRIDDDDF